MTSCHLLFFFKEKVDEQEFQGMVQQNVIFIYLLIRSFEIICGHVLWGCLCRWVSAFPPVIQFANFALRSTLGISVIDRIAYQRGRKNCKNWIERRWKGGF